MVRAYAGWALAGLLCLAACVLLWPTPAGSPAEREAIAQGRTVVLYWDRHSGHEHRARVDLMDEYNRTQGVKDGVYVRALPIGINVLMEKMLTCIAAGSPPDICSIDTVILAQLASQGCFSPLGDLIETEPELQEDKFMAHTWKMVHFRGFDASSQDWREDVWGIPTTTDTYCLLWNKDCFRKAGLDPDRPPRNLKELEEYAAKLTIRNDVGIEQFGFVPWFPWDLTYMWGGLFGGKWCDPATGEATCAGDPGIIASFAWQQRFATNPNTTEQLPVAIDPARTQSFERMGAYQSSNNPFYTGKVAMLAEGEWQVTFTEKYAPDLDWGVVPIPQPEGVEPLAYGPSCIADAVPTGARHREEALKFLRWFYRPRPNGGTSPASDYNLAIHNIPPRRAEAMDERFTSNPKFRVFVENLLDRNVIQDPVSPVSQYFLDQVSNNREYVIRYEKTPEQAAQDIQTLSNEAIEDDPYVSKVRP